MAEYQLSEDRQKQLETVMAANPALTTEEAIKGLISIQGAQGVDVSDLELALGLEPSDPQSAPAPDGSSDEREEVPVPPAPEVVDDSPIDESPAFELADERVKLESDDDEAPSRTPPKPGKGGRRRPAPSKPVRNVFKKVLPTGDLLRVYFTGPTGRKDFIDKYRQRDIQKSGDIESFIKEYLYPDYGPGEYFLEQQDPKGDVTPRGSIRIKGKAQKDDNVMATKDIIDLTQKAAENAKKEAEGQTSAITSMFNGFMQMMASQQNQQKNDGGDGQMMMMMMSMLSTILPMMMQKREDPMMPMVLNMLMKQAEKENAPAVPFPPMPASSPPNDSLDTIRAFAELQKAVQPQQQQLSISELAALLGKKENTMAEVMQMVGLLKDFIKPSTEGAKSFSETLENVNAIRGLLEEMNPRSDFSFGSLAEMLNSMAVAYRDTNVAKAMSQQPGVQQVGPGQQAPQQGQPQTPQQTVKPPIGEKEKFRQSAPPIPLGFRRFSLAMKKAIRDQDEDELVSQFLEGLSFLHENGEQRWREFVEKFQEYVKNDDREKAMVLVKGFLRTFEANDLINAEMAETIYESMDLYWGDVAVALGYREEPEPEPEEEADVPSPNAGIQERAAEQRKVAAQAETETVYHRETGRIEEVPVDKKPEPPAPDGRVDPDNPTTGDVLTHYEAEEDDGEEE